MGAFLLGPLFNRLWFDALMVIIGVWVVYGAAMRFRIPSLRAIGIPGGGTRS
jgi:hypothetical protein